MFSDTLFIYLTSLPLMSSADRDILDAKNRSKNPLKTHFSHVMCFGTFDIFHPGHHYYLSEASSLADRMTVVIARDQRVLSGKWQQPLHDEHVRLEWVSASFSDASVILGHESDIFAPMRDLHPDLLAFGYDQKVPEVKIKELFPNIEIIRIGGYEVEKYKSSILKKSLHNNSL